MPKKGSAAAGQPLCLNTLPGTEVNAFRDNDHVNTAGSIYLWPHMCDAMEAVGLM